MEVKAGRGSARIGEGYMGVYMEVYTVIYTGVVWIL